MKQTNGNIELSKVRVKKAAIDYRDAKSGETYLVVTVDLSAAYTRETANVIGVPEDQFAGDSKVEECSVQKPAEVMALTFTPIKLPGVSSVNYKILSASVHKWKVTPKSITVKFASKDNVSSIIEWARDLRGEIFIVELESHQRDLPLDDADDSDQEELFEENKPEEEPEAGLELVAAAANGAAYEQPIEKLRLSARSLKPLKGQGVMTVGELCEIAEPRLRQMKGIGKMSVGEIKGALERLDLQLASLT